MESKGANAVRCAGKPIAPLPGALMVVLLLPGVHGAVIADAIGAALHQSLIWCVPTNTVDASGHSAITNTISPAAPQSYYRLKL
jgi:hypothetical protein